jgi:hypothetical protein
MSDWQKLYESCLAERDRDKLLQCIIATEEAILARSLELDEEANGHRERQQMSYALSNLLTLKSERLGWPHPADSQNRSALPDA